MAIAQTYRSAWLTTSSSPRWLVLHPRLHNRPLSHRIRRAQRKSHGRGTSLGPRLGRGGAGLGGAIDVGEELCERRENVESG